MPSEPARFGITVPLEGVALHEHRAWFDRLAELGYTDAWSSEVDGSDAFTPLALAAAWRSDLRLGTAIVPVFTRGPAVLAQSVASLADAAPGRFHVGIGASSPVIVSDWNGIPFEEPFERMRDTLRFLRAALAGDKVTADYGTFAVNGFRLARPPAISPPLYVAALRPRMLRLAGAEGDGAILNWLSPGDVAKSVAEVGPGKEIVARIFVLPTADADAARAAGRRMITAYMNVPAYAAFQRWLGRGPRLQAMWDAWAAGDRRAALDAVPDDVVDDLVVHGSVAACRERIEEYVRAGVTVPVLAVTPVGNDLATVLGDLAPGR